ARHNLNYWAFGDFIGIGAGAHGKLSHPDGRIIRTWKTRLPKDYLNPDKPFQAGAKLLPLDELPFEFLMNALRLTNGVDAALFRERTGLSLDSLAEARRQAEQKGLLHEDPARLIATPQGQLFLNDLLQYFLI
ncbi:YggW family oxidoreductase, partial [Pseudomonas syringae pv. actinidifoliorum]|nr:YggW family oxidoreductase [Pseudomonas syringae pv. actinidifoliorum]